VAGSGPCSAELQEELNVRVPGRARFLGHCDRDRLAALYRAVDIFIHPNPREPFGIAPIEAMAAGLPVVAPDSGGLLTYANQENAWLARAEAAQFADAVRAIVREPKEAGDRVARARETAARFSWDTAMQRYFDLYDHF